MQVCPECGRLQSNRERCQNCGARLPVGQSALTSSTQQPLGALPAERSAIVNVAVYVLLILLGIVLVGTLCILLLSWVL